MSDVRNKIQEIIEQNRVVLFMKGTKSFPQCGFSAARRRDPQGRAAPSSRTSTSSPDPAIRQGIKEFSSWPTIPQVYIDGKFVGGSDILIEMYQSGELAEAAHQDRVLIRQTRLLARAGVTERAARAPRRTSPP